MDQLVSAGNWVVKVAEELVETLTPTVELDWESKTPDLDWTQTQTAIHTMRAALEYSYQVVGKRMDSYQPILFEKKEKASPADYLPMILTAAKVLQKVVKNSDVKDRAWHAYGISDPIGFAAMGVIEISVHTYDLAKGFGIEFLPNNMAAKFAIDRLFSGTTEYPLHASHGELLLWLAGRIELSGHSRRQNWKWSGIPR
ncbi:MAG: hypothetical protein F2761_00050 [Actinobacteria bacterium]|uniref:Unannotated protein n=1 Tax=freshwater metagenome TaxID=449393 RepID=A0A6J6ZAJ2_9ZZZZ|nr:hypothetical protein [Actinomycetota bacterium]